MRLRKTLANSGYDAGAATIAEHLTRDPAVTKVPTVAAIWRILTRRGFVTPQPQKRPRSSWKRFEADLPNQCWQADVTHWRLADHSDVEILDIIDDSSRLGSKAPPRLSTGSCSTSPPQPLFARCDLTVRKGFAIQRLQSPSRQLLLGQCIAVLAGPARSFKPKFSPASKLW